MRTLRQEPLPPFERVHIHEDAHDTAVITSAQGPWLTLLEHMHDCGAGRLTYCFVLKRWIDAGCAGLLLVLLSPLLVLIAVAVRLEAKGPVIFRQVRVGLHGRTFVMYKFSTMVPDRRKAQRPFNGPDRRVHHKTVNDPRITRVGRFLRRTSLDELPQLVNVLRGEMSLVGPRPELPHIVTRYAPWQHRRHLVKPGITGWWQVEGRGVQPMYEHTDLDLYYVANQSFSLDTAILLRTIVVLLVRKGAF